MAPNGDTEWSPEYGRTIEDAFDEICSALREFAGRYGLMLDVYYHGWPVWSLRFRRRVGGNASIAAFFNTESRDRFEIRATWACDDYDTRRRYIRRMHPPLVFPRGGRPEELLGCLERALAIIDSWETGKWDETGGPYREWARLAREQVEGNLRGLPVR